jgi:uncharacterized protein (DUF58 family)
VNVPTTYKYLPPPFAESLNGLGVFVRRPVHGSIEGLHRSPNFGASVEFAEYREYTPGDPIHLIDWAVYARTDRHVIRQFHEETNLRAYVLLDTSESMVFREEGPKSKMDYACFLAAGLLYILLRQGDMAGLITFDHRTRDVFEPISTFTGVRPMLLHLEQIRPARRSDIEAVLHEVAATIKSKSLVILISDLLQDPEKILRGWRHLFHDGHNLIVLHVLDPGEQRLSFGGVVELRELETGARMVVEADEIRDAYRAAVERYVNVLRLGCTECMGDYRLVDTRHPVEEELNRLQTAAHVQ